MAVNNLYGSGLADVPQLMIDSMTRLSPTLLTNQSPGGAFGTIDHMDQALERIHRRIDKLSAEHQPTYDGQILTMEVNWKAQKGPVRFECSPEHLCVAAGLSADIHLKLVTTTPSGALAIVAMIDGQVAAHQFSADEATAGGAVYIETILKWRATQKPEPAAAGQSAA